MMRAMLLNKPGQPLRLAELPIPQPGPHQVLLRVRACGVCRTDLHIIDGELTAPKLPLILGHQIVGTVIKTENHASVFKPGQRVGVPWLGQTCQHCRYCLNHQENLCDNALFTGYTLNGGYAEYAIANQQFCFPIPDTFPDLQAAPLLCAGLIGYRAYRMVKDAKRIGFYGFGAAAHILVQLARFQSREVYAFTRPGDVSSQQFAKRLGAVWAGGSDEPPPELLDAAIIFAPAGSLVPAALRAVIKGGIVVCAGIHMSDIPAFSYDILWGERQVRSVANLTRQDGEDFLRLAPQVPIKTEVTRFSLEAANDAITALRAGHIDGAAVLVPETHR
ncbi:zinc-binding alcohol dehydrogenase family protein [Synechococcus sp. PCC 7335]|uniref:zinc-dependent alcohol dehydrogenase family protein n=1 Tax=Synechococcus sp. (strain ATCC 29403 / PCC 7335) TaxID=91464 RepID=UPI00017ED9E2|nr:zinc-dependent alcohol dehydrogenase family protein [Synechococcus sp. PCC 7335]EDX82868.1 zinc-binding alcohol dehydrogenase family protein [Synechococcus sp. PCC 7335]